MIGFAVAAGLSPIPIIGVVLMLGTPRARVNGPAFLAAWAASILIAALIVLAVSSGGSSDDSTHSSSASALNIVFGVLLLLLALKQWRSRPAPGETPPTPGWMERVDQFSALHSAGLAVLLTVANPKNLVLVIAGAREIGGAGASTGEEFAALLVFTAIASIGVAAPLAIYFGMGARATALLERMHSWLARRNAVIMTVVCGVLGLLLIAQALAG
jgi:threonine/homoserine/homoserine lactone efflux protein